MHEYARILIEDYCMKHDSTLSRELSRLVDMTYDLYAEASEEDAAFLRRAIEQETNPELKEAMEELEDYLFYGDDMSDFMSMLEKLAEEFPINNQKKILKLHLELVGGFLYGASEDWDMRPEEKQKLMKLARAEKGISRDIYVPNDMNLYALHYAIQRLFGWQNSHLHCFSLSQGDFAQMTNNQLGAYTSLCGVLFRFPNDDYTDLYWDDDPMDSSSVKTFLRKRYRRPYHCGAVADTYFGNQWEVENFRSRFPQFRGQDTLYSIEEKIAIEEDFNNLIEGLTIGEVLQPGAFSKADMAEWKEEVEDNLTAMLEDMDDCGVDTESWKVAASELKYWRQSLGQLDHIKWQNPTTYHREARKLTGMSFEQAWQENQEQIALWEDACRNQVFQWNISINPLFNELYYLYDYGDDWCVKITAVEELQKPPADVNWDDNVVCVSADGLNLVDDCGGIGGYLDMLETIHGSDKEEAQVMRNWARMMGWTGRKSRPEKML